MKNMKDMGGQKKGFVLEKGVIYFSKQTERRIFFVLTLLMLIWGIVDKIYF